MKPLLVLLLAAAPAFADSKTEQAAKANDEGKQLMFGQQYEAAAKKFEAAVALVPDPRYLFNLCTADFQQGKFAAALTACDEVGKHKPDDALKSKTDKMIVKIKDEAQRQNIKLK